MAIITKDSLAFLGRYLNNASPTGYESSGQKIWLEYLKPYIDDWHLDVYGTAYGVINPDAKYKVVIEGHADEISWYVNYISDKGFIHVIRNGGSDQMIAPGKRVDIHTKKGVVRGVFGWPAIHMRTEGDKTPSTQVENLFIDVGASNKKEVEKLGVHIGSVITYTDGFEIMNKNFFVSRALDNRLGGFCIAEVARLLKQKKVKLPFGLYIVNSVQEEVGLRGASMIAETLSPDVAIVIDVTHDTHTPHLKVAKHGDVKLGLGPVVTYAPAVHNKLLDLIIDVAETQKIPFQRSASSRVTGTDTDAFAYARGGIPSSLISIPLRYMHTTVEMAHRADVENVISLILESLKRIKSGQSFQYF
jgi:putative aminopeptidase FrvX